MFVHYSRVVIFRTAQEELNCVHKMNVKINFAAPSHSIDKVSEEFRITYN